MGVKVCTADLRGPAGQAWYLPKELRSSVERQVALAALEIPGMEGLQNWYLASMAETLPIQLRPRHHYKFVVREFWADFDSPCLLSIEIDNINDDIATQLFNSAMQTLCNGFLLPLPRFNSEWIFVLTTMADQLRRDGCA